MSAADAYRASGYGVAVASLRVLVVVADAYRAAGYGVAAASLG